MAKQAVLEREHALGNAVFASGSVAVTLAPSAYRMNLRAGDDAVKALEKALGITLPRKPKTSETKGSRSALWLGPDEWLIIDEKADPNVDVAKAKGVYSAVDVSHRNTAILVSGASAADVLNGGCPQDLSLETFPVGAASRTILGKVEVVLVRVKPTVFRVEVWRSFSRYAFDLLEASARDAG